ncbi:MAG: deoxyguanosinetriphosphate triphosphohydrolase [Ignavibacteriaceae bacterium]|nr:deoxyguanosinetriphosphate triphosphohydrolase [Ignavibacteriaceae bacterium]
MKWNILLNKNLLCSENKTDQSEDGRSQYQRDFDRIVFSSAFRRLQDKTQVFPLPESDFVHTRLTHSLEVSCVGRSLGTKAGKFIIDRHKELKGGYENFHFGEIVAAACLAHDIGNPPFGHSGEDAISEYFRSGNGRQYQKKINDEKKWADFTKFEGNAQGFRIITRLQNPNITGGLRLTHATLASFTKYPKESFTAGVKNMKVKESKLYKKFGFFQSEKQLFEETAAACGLIRDDNSFSWRRHPLAFLVEAADDTCYRIMDLEDGFRLGLLPFETTEQLLKPLTGSKPLQGYNGRDENDKIGYLRAKAINNVIEEITETFLDCETEILNGKFDDSLLSIIKSGEPLKVIKDVSVEKIYSYKSVVEREAAGYEVLAGLLDTFITAVNDSAENVNLSWKNKTILKLLPKQFLCSSGKPDDDIYLRLLKITDFVSGMTDSYAVSLFRKIKGISLPGR